MLEKWRKKQFWKGIRNSMLSFRSFWGVRNTYWCRSASKLSVLKNIAERGWGHVILCSQLGATVHLKVSVIQTLTHLFLSVIFNLISLLSDRQHLAFYQSNLISLIWNSWSRSNLKTKVQVRVHLFGFAIAKMNMNYKIMLDKTVPNPEHYLPNFVGKWNFVRKENFDEFLKACGINFLLRKTASALTPTEIIGHANDQGKYFLK